MTHFLDPMITASCWAGLGYLAVGMALHLSNKFRRIDSNAVPVPKVLEPPAATVPAVEDQATPVRCGNLRHAPITSNAKDRIVPFKRPQRQVSDTDLIKLAKTLARQGRYSKSALKWSFKRQLSSKVRAELLALAS